MKLDLINKNKYSNAVTVALETSGNESRSYKESLLVTNRFTHMISGMKEGDSINIRFVPDKTHNAVCSVFTGGDLVSELKDISWIFFGCGQVNGASVCDPEDLGAEGRQIFCLKMKCDASDDYRHGLHEAEISADLFSDLAKMLIKENVMVQLSVVAPEESKIGSEEDPYENYVRSGIILLSVPGNIPLRLRSFLSIALPLLDVVKVDDGSDIELLSSSCMERTSASLLNGYRNAQSSETCECINEYSASYDEEAGIEDLNLSFRVYTSLKRSGINDLKTLIGKSDEELLKIKYITPKRLSEIHIAVEAHRRISVIPAGKSGNGIKDLEALIGLKDVKAQVKRISSYAMMTKDIKDSGKSEIPLSLNMMFTGNPGTAKTTVARIMANILYETGILRSKEMIEVGRADLVAGYVGQTAEKVKTVFKRAKGKLLFIDEAYSLIDPRDNSFGDEAISTIVQEMENHREDTVVIFAGYPDKMEEFIEKNPGLRSRVPFCINFPDYTVDEMTSIAEAVAASMGFKVSEDAVVRIADLCRETDRIKDRGNGRFCRNLIEDAVLNYAQRMYGDGETDEKTFELKAEDFTLSTLMKYEKKSRHMGFVA